MKTMSLIGGIDTYAFDKRFKSDESPIGRQVVFLGKNGYEKELEQTKKLFSENQILTVKEIYVGRSSSTVEFQELPGKEFNTVMFGDLNQTEEESIKDLPF